MALHVLGWTLLHFCWQGAAVAGMLWCVLALLGGKASAMRYGAACGALGLMVAAPLVTFWELAMEARRAGFAGQVPVADWVITVVPGGAGGGLWMERLAAGLDGATPFVPWVWLAGVVVFAVRLQLGLVVAGRMTTEETERIVGPLAGRFEELKERLGVRRVVRLVQTARVEVPTVIGWLRPVVLMPVGCLARLSTAQVEALLVHELAHIRRQDYLVNVLQSVVEALLFYHPAVWWVSKQVRLERECCCDRMAAEVGGDALGYAKALSFLETRRAFLQEVALGANGGVLTMRIKRLLGVRESSVVSQGVALALLAAVVMVPAGYMATTARAERGAARLGRATLPVETMRSETAGEVAPVEALRPAGKVERLLVARVEVPAAAGQEQGPQRVSGGVMAGQIASRVNPVYPAEAKENGIQGAVVLKAVISKEGTVENLQVVSGPAELRASAIDAVRQWMYKPYLLNGQPTEVETTITVNYHLGDRSEGSGSSSGGSSSSSVSSSSAGSSSSSSSVQADEAEQAERASRAQRISGGVMAGQVLSRVDPVYPAEAKENRIQGAVVLKALISKEGTVENLQVVSGPRELMRSALDAVRQWTYKPYLLNGEPTEVSTTITVNYHLADGLSEVVTPKKIGNGVLAPTVLHTENPSYSEEGKKGKISGSVLVKLVVDQQGDPTQVRIVRGIGYGLDEKAVEAVKRYKFKPAMEDGKPVAVAMNIQVNFQVF